MNIYSVKKKFNKKLYYKYTNFILKNQIINV